MKENCHVVRHCCWTYSRYYGTYGYLACSQLRGIISSMLFYLHNHFLRLAIWKPPNILIICGMIDDIWIASTLTLNDSQFYPFWKCNFMVFLFLVAVINLRLGIIYSLKVFLTINFRGHTILDNKIIRTTQTVKD